MELVSTEYAEGTRHSCFELWPAATRGSVLYLMSAGSFGSGFGTWLVVVVLGVDATSLHQVETKDASKNS